MKLFENGVGRPSNEIKKKRRLFITVAVLIVVLVAVGSLVILNSVNKNTSKLKAAAVSNNGIFNKTRADVNEDGKVNRDDLVTLKKYLYKIYPYESIKKLADSNNDGSFDIMDGFDYDEQYSMCEKGHLSDYCNVASVNDVRIAIYDDLYRSKSGQWRDYPNGDINGDKNVDKKDYTLLVNYLNKYDKVQSKTIVAKNLWMVHTSSSDKNASKNTRLGVCGAYKNTGTNIRTGGRWGKTLGYNLYVSYKDASCIDWIYFGDASKYSKMTIYYQYASNEVGMKSNVSFYMNDLKRIASKNVTSPSKKTGTMTWSSTQKLSVNLYTEHEDVNKLLIKLDHGSNKNGYTFAVKIIKIVLE